MSRIGRLPFELPDKVDVKIENTSEYIKVEVKGPKGSLTQNFLPYVEIVQEGNVLKINRKKDEKIYRAQHGLVRALVFNMVEGVSKGYSKTLEIVGSGYRARMEGKTLVMQLGFSHDVRYEPPEGITFEVDDGRKIRISGIDKQKVGQIAANIRAIRPPDAYKGKGLRYEGEEVITKVGKKAGG